MSRFSRLTVVVADFTDSSASIRTRPDTLYARLAGRGSVQSKWVAHDAERARLLPWQRGLLEALQLDERTHPSAPLTALSAGLDLERTWLHAEFVHFAAGLSDVALVSLNGEHAITPAERASLSATLRSHVETALLTIETTAFGDCLLGSPRALDVQTVTPPFARTQEWSVALPRGSDAGFVRRLMTELQMLLHEHPVNAARAARGVPTANAVWLWGNGHVGRDARTDAPVCVGSNVYLAGICRAEGWHAPRALVNVEQILIDLDTNADAVIVLGLDAPPDLQLQVLSTAVQALENGRYRALDLVLDEWQVSVDRWSLKKFWRAPRSIERWTQA